MCVYRAGNSSLFSLPFPPPSHPLIHHTELCRTQNQNSQPERKFKSVNTFLFLRCSLFFSFHWKQLCLFSSPAPFMDCKCLEGEQFSWRVQVLKQGSCHQILAALRTMSNLSTSLQHNFIIMSMQQRCIYDSHKWHVIIQVKCLTPSRSFLCVQQTLPYSFCFLVYLPLGKMGQVTK